MKHNTNYKFSDQIENVRDFFKALATDYSIGATENRNLIDEVDSFQLTIYSDDDSPNVAYTIFTLDDCLRIATSRLDFMYRLSKRGYLVADY